jgi:hypothetical protein
MILYLNVINLLLLRESITTHQKIKTVQTKNNRARMRLTFLKIWLLICYA